ncbi:GIY-YIG nuclease family protein [Vibrio scophthalmi]
MTRKKWTLSAVREEALKYKQRSKFKQGSGGAFSAARRNGWLEDVCSHMEYTKKQSGYWTFARALEVAKKCKTPSEFQYGTGNKGAYGAAQKNGWLPRMYAHIEEVRKPKGFWTEERVRQEALKYKSRMEFEKNCSSAYGYALRHKLMDDICSHMEHIGNRAKRCIYAIFSVERNEAYVGLTFSFQKRMLEHKNGYGHSTKELVTYPDTKYEKLTKYIDASLAAQLESEYVQKYRDKGFKLLNNESALGALGGKEPWTFKRVKHEARKYTSRIDFKNAPNSAYRIACEKGWLEEATSHMSEKVCWTYEHVEQEAAKYKTRKEFIQGNNSAYVVACREGWTDKVCAHMERLSTPNGYWTLERCKSESKKYKTRGEFKKHSPLAMRAAYRNGWINEVCYHMDMRKKQNGFWDKEACEVEALKYTTRSDFSKGASGAYDSAKKNKWLEDICNHMTSVQRPTGYWNKERCYEAALLYNTRTEFNLNNKSAYSSARNNGWLDEICSHMKSNRKPRGHWQIKENCRQEALKYSSKMEFKAKSSAAYSSSVKNGWLDYICSHMI